MGTRLVATVHQPVFCRGALAQIVDEGVSGPSPGSHPPRPVPALLDRAPHDHPLRVPVVAIAGPPDGHPARNRLGLELTRDPPTGDPLPLPTERQWKDGMKWQRR